MSREKELLEAYERFFKQLNITVDYEYDENSSDVVESINIEYGCFDRELIGAYNDIENLYDTRQGDEGKDVVSPLDHQPQAPSLWYRNLSGLNNNNTDPDTK